MREIGLAGRLRPSAANRRRARSRRRRRSGRGGTREEGARDRQKVVGDGRAPTVRTKTRKTGPRASREAKGPFEKRDGGFDPCAKALQDAAHARGGCLPVERNAGGLGEAGFARPRGLERCEVVPRCEATVEGGSLRSLTEERGVSLRGPHGQRRIGRIALLDHEIEDKAAAP